MAAAVTEAVAHLEPASLRYGAVDADVVACPSMVPRCLSDSLYSSDPNRFTDEKFRLIEARRAEERQPAPPALLPPAHMTTRSLPYGNRQ